MRGPLLLELAVDEKKLLGEIFTLTFHAGIPERKFEKDFPELFGIYKILMREGIEETLGSENLDLQELMNMEEVNNV